MTQRRILVIEDDPGIRRGVVDALTISGYHVLEAARGDTGLKAALSESFDLLLLDLVLPGRDGLAILEEVRRVRATTPVIILTARGEETDRLRGFRLGADDYVVKPFSVKELLARVEAVLRRSPERPVEVASVAFPGGSADLQRCELRFEDGARVELSERERDILRYLAASPSRAISREELLQRVWQVDPRGIETRTIDMTVARLREKLRDNAAEPRIVLTVRGKGYKLGAEVRSA
ncbi:Transcriptional regulatory protein WalR [Phycisphaerae bacterium RAS1]|nr:Transcriptional regulatory protein WalR [Phycisphaerae bacterium RAS1]